MKEFISVPFIERLIGYADEVRMSTNLDEIKFNNEYELSLHFKESSDEGKYLILGVFMNREILLKEPYKGQGMMYLLGYKENMLSVLKIDHAETNVLEYDMKELDKVHEMIDKMVEEDY